MRRVVEAEDRQHALDVQAGRPARHQHHRLLAVLVRIVRRGLAHNDEDGAARVAGAGGPPLPPIDHVVITLAGDAGLDVGGVGRRDVGLRHAEAGADLAFQQRRQPALLVRLGAVAVDGLHVARIGGGAVEHLGRPGDAAHDLGQRGVFQVGQPGAEVAFRQEQVPQPGGARLGLQLLDDRHRLPAVRRHGDLVVVGVLVRVDMVVEEGQQAGAELLDLFGIGEVHGVLPFGRSFSSGSVTQRGGAASRACQRARPGQPSCMGRKCE